MCEKVNEENKKNFFTAEKFFDEAHTKEIKREIEAQAEFKELTIKIAIKTSWFSFYDLTVSRTAPLCKKSNSFEWQV